MFDILGDLCLEMRHREGHKSVLHLAYILMKHKQNVNLERNDNLLRSEASQTQALWSEQTPTVLMH